LFIIGKYYQGDIRLSREQTLTKYAFGSMAVTTKRWPKTGDHIVIKYQIDPIISKATSVINEAIKEYESKTCLRFIEDKSTDINLTPHIKFSNKNGEGCSSPVGKSNRKVNDRFTGNEINLDGGGWFSRNTCWIKGTVVHEMAHSIGFFHEQSRMDRDSYVKINFKNVKPVDGKPMHYNFHKEFQINSRGHKYDYLSVMHYTKTAFGDGDVTIVTLDPAYQDKIGQRNGLSDGDVEQINGVFCK